MCHNTFRIKIFLAFSDMAVINFNCYSNTISLCSLSFNNEQNITRHNLLNIFSGASHNRISSFYSMRSSEGYSVYIVFILMVQFLSSHVTFIMPLGSLMLCLLQMERLSLRERTNLKRISFVNWCLIAARHVISLLEKVYTANIWPLSISHLFASRNIFCPRNIVE